MTATEEDGRIMLLTAGFVAVGLMLVGMVALAASVHLDRKHLFDLADSLAVAGADSMREATCYDLENVGEPGEAGALTLTDANVRRAVGQHLALQPASTSPDLRDVQVVEAVSPDGRGARVRARVDVAPAVDPVVHRLARWRHHRNRYGGRASGVARRDGRVTRRVARVRTGPGRRRRGRRRPR